MWRNRYERYYCNNCTRYFYTTLFESPVVICVDCGSDDTEPMPYEMADVHDDNEDSSIDDLLAIDDADDDGFLDDF